VIGRVPEHSNRAHVDDASDAGCDGCGDERGGSFRIHSHVFGSRIRSGLSQNVRPAGKVHDDVRAFQCITPVGSRPDVTNYAALRWLVWACAAHREPMFDAACGQSLPEMLPDEAIAARNQHPYRFTHRGHCGHPTFRMPGPGSMVPARRRGGSSETFCGRETASAAKRF
jgi:hypothetical protein